MSFWSFESLPPWAMALSLAAHLAVGMALGVAYFCALRQNARLFASGRHMATAVALTIGRFGLLSVVLALASFDGALSLLVTTLGVLIARSAVIHSFKGAAP